MQFLGYLDRQEQRMRTAVDCIRARQSAREEQVLGAASSALYRGRRKRNIV